MGRGRSRVRVWVEIALFCTAPMEGKPDAWKAPF